MTVLNQNITLYQGDVISVLFTISDDNNAPIDITTATFIWGLFRVATEVATVTKTVGAGLTRTDPTHGVLSLALVRDDTKNLQGDWLHELSMTLGGVTEIVSSGNFRINLSSVQ